MCLTDVHLINFCNLVRLNSSNTFLSGRVTGRRCVGRYFLNSPVLLPQFLFADEGKFPSASQVVEAAIRVHGPTILSWQGGVATSIIGLTGIGPAVEASGSQWLVCKDTQHG
jgi:hypothetical protein